MCEQKNAKHGLFPERAWLKRSLRPVLSPFCAVDVRACVLMCVLSYVASADSAVITVAILITLASLLTVTIAVFVKRKTLLRLLFANKKSTLEKFR